MYYRQLDLAIDILYILWIDYKKNNMSVNIEKLFSSTKLLTKNLMKYNNI